MAKKRPAPADAETCAGCGRRLLPLTYTRGPFVGHPVGVDNRPGLKCPGCGQSFRWQPAGGWVPAATARAAPRA